jgi:hypothetical protein
VGGLRYIFGFKYLMPFCLSLEKEEEKIGFVIIRLVLNITCCPGETKKKKKGRKMKKD